MKFYPKMSLINKQKSWLTGVINKLILKTKMLAMGAYRAA
jgi:hypothetical protein